MLRVFLSSLFSFILFAATPPVFSDTVLLKDGEELKGVVVEQHTDRIILSTENGEVPVFMKSVKNIQYDDPEQSFLQIGRKMEENNKLGEALAYYEKALEANPNFEEAKKAAAGVRNRFWTNATEGPVNEIEKQQVLYDAWGQGRAVDDVAQENEVAQKKLLKERLGLALEKKGDFVRLQNVDSSRPAAEANLKKNDRLISIDGMSLRYLSEEAVAKNLLTPRYSNFTLEYERDCYLRPEGSLNIGCKMRLEHQGLVIHSVKEGGVADNAGVLEGDLLTYLDGVSTRYMPIKKVLKLIQDAKDDRIVFSVRRSVLLARR